MRQPAVFAIGYDVDDLTRVMTAKLYWQNKATISKDPNEANGLLEGKPIPKPSTRKELAAFLNKLADKVGILYHPVTNPNGYLATEDNIG